MWHLLDRNVSMAILSRPIDMHFAFSESFAASIKRLIHRIVCDDTRRAVRNDFREKHGDTKADCSIIL
jgi:adenylate kinase family enzyme